MTDAEISRRLALAIGWQDDEEDPDVIPMNRFWNSEEMKCHVWFNNSWVEFDVALAVIKAHEEKK